MKIINKAIFLILVGFLFLGACKTKNIGSQTDVIRVDEENWNNEDNVSETEELDTAEKENAADDLQLARDTATIDESLKKKHYKIAVILPFEEDSVRQAWNLASKKNFEEFESAAHSELAISFTEGMLMALKDMSLKSKFELVLFDDENSPSKIPSILAKIKKDSFDVIIGPALKTNLLSVSKFAQEHKLIHLSPFSPSRSVGLGNSNYYMLEPSLNQHIMSMVSYSLDSIDEANIKFLYHGRSSGDEYAQNISSFIDALNDSLDIDARVNYANIELGSDNFIEDFTLSKYLEDEGHNVIIVNSFNENFIHHFLRQVNKARKKYTLTVFGMPGWENSETVRLDYLNSNNIHFTESFWFDQNEEEALAFENIYKDKYQGRPSEYVYLGYDVATLFFPLIDSVGLKFNNNLLHTDFKPKVRTYHFTKALNNQGDIEWIENTSLRIYKIEDFERRIVK